MPNTLTAEQLARDLALRDLTDPQSGPHAIQQLVDIAVDALTASWDCQTRIERGPRVVALTDNYDRLRYPPAAVTRDTRYTRYVDAAHVLRSHTSAMIPPALARLAADPTDDVLVVCPGITYRRDAIDRLHTGTPHQLDLWRISRRPVGETDLLAMLAVLVDALLPRRRWRWEGRVHPYTLAGRQVDVADGDEWVEVLECGLAHPDVLAGAGLAGWSGLALGMGLDRILMLRKGVPDIRLLRSTDPRVAGQMHDLGPYRTVSDLPAVTRDLSIGVAAGVDTEQLGDRVREALGDRADLLEAVTVVSETDYADLPAAARERLGMTETQKNVLVRLAIRPYDRTLTDSEANDLRDHVYAAIHEGVRGQWAQRKEGGAS
jgi:phenylalanyl-tRNA synthetase alpha chain